MNILITGCSRGIGLEFVRQYLSKGDTVYASCREPDAANNLLQLRDCYPERLFIEKLDACDDGSIEQLAQKLSKVPIDILINNAATAGQSGVTIGNIDRSNFIKVFETNCLGVLKISEAFLPHLRRSDKKIITVISSRMGSISDNTSGRSYAYRSSKTALNAVMRSFAIDTQAIGIKVLLLHPGWVQTRMGGEKALVSPGESVSLMIEKIQHLGPTAHAEVMHRFDNGQPIPH